jgi:hypothetical protein
VLLAVQEENSKALLVHKSYMAAVRPGAPATGSNIIIIIIIILIRRRRRRRRRRRKVFIHSTRYSCQILNGTSVFWTKFREIII